MQHSVQTQATQVSPLYTHEIRKGTDSSKGRRGRDSVAADVGGLVLLLGRSNLLSRIITFLRDRVVAKLSVVETIANGLLHRSGGVGCFWSLLWVQIFLNGVVKST